MSILHGFGRAVFIVENCKGETNHGQQAGEQVIVTPLLEILLVILGDLVIQLVINCLFLLFCLLDSFNPRPDLRRGERAIAPLRWAF